jgi:D-3-phosphoglycerate dehydrogenase / 2-oxoglutarate reductase
MDSETILIFDFDSTFVSVETLDLLARHTVGSDSTTQKSADSAIADEIEKITNMGMEGTIPFAESLSRRLKLLKLRKQDIDTAIPLLKTKVTPSILRNRKFLADYAGQIYIVSSGFTELITPVTDLFGISFSHVFANTLKFDNKGNVTGVDRRNPLSKNNGKTKIVSLIKKSANAKHAWIIGDGYTDYEVRKHGVADKFFASAEVVSRIDVLSHADTILKSFDEFLYKYKLPRALSYPKTRIKVLVLEGVHDEAVKKLQDEGYEVHTIASALAENELIKLIQNVTLLCIRSGTNITPRVLKHAYRLLAVGAFCIGTNQIDLKSCSKRGVACFNAPYSNTRSVVELVVGYIVMLLRGLGDKNTKLHEGIWTKTDVNSYEVRGKKLGILGYGNIGSQLSVVAEALGMEVYFYDHTEKLALGNAKIMNSMNELLRTVDILSVHVDGRLENRGLIGKREIGEMRDNTYIINASRGHIVDYSAVADAITSGKLAGAAVDVYPTEPKSNKQKLTSVLRGLPNVILTPHIGGATSEAQVNIGRFVADKMIRFVNTGDTTLSVNFPQIALPEQKDAHRVLHVHQNIPGVLASINSIFGTHRINIEGQYLQTNSEIGYVITDVNTAYDEHVVQALKKVDGTIRVRVLY